MKKTGKNLKKISALLLALIIILAAVPFTSTALESPRQLGNAVSPIESLDLVSSYPLLKATYKLPKSVDLSESMPTPLNQIWNNCTAMSVGYALRTWQEQEIRGWGQNDPEHQFSPAFIYNIATNGVDEGMSIYAAMDIVAEYGVCTYDSMPDYIPPTVMPTSAQMKEAAKYKISEYYYLGLRSSYWEQSSDDWKAVLSSNVPLVIGIPIFEDYWNIGYDGYDNIYDNMNGPYYGRHAMCVVGYDDDIVCADGTKGAFKFINSWGDYWADNGYGYISYALVDSTGASTPDELSWEAWVAASASADSDIPKKILMRLNSTNALFGITSEYGYTPVDPKNEDVYPFTLLGKTMVPVRFIENMGAKVKYNGTESPVIIKYKDIELSITFGKNVMSKKVGDGKAENIDLPTAPTLVEGKTCVPIREIAEGLGFIVKYDKKTRVIVTSTRELTDKELAEDIEFAAYYLDSFVEGVKSIQAIEPNRKVGVGKNNLEITANDIKFSPTKVGCRRLLYSSSNEKIATVSSSGRVAGKKAGKVEITVLSHNGKETTFYVTVS